MNNNEIAQWEETYAKWRRTTSAHARTALTHYPYATNEAAPFTPIRRSLPLVNLALVTAAGAYIDGTRPFSTDDEDGDFEIREIPTLVEAQDLLYQAHDFDAKDVQTDRNCQIPIDRLEEFAANGIIGSLNSVFWSCTGYAPNIGRFVTEAARPLVERLKRYDVQAVLLIPASRMGHQTLGAAARVIEEFGLPTMTLGVERSIFDHIIPPRAVYYDGEFGRVAGEPNWKQYQSRILDETLRLIEPMTQPEVRKLTVKLESEVEIERGER